MRPGADDLQLTRFEQLLWRYPHISEAENREVAELLLQTGPLDMALLSANQPAWDKAERYREESPAVFRMSVTRGLWPVALVVLTAAIIWWPEDVAIR